MIVNKLKTVILLGALSGLFLCIGSLLGGEQGLFFALILSLIMNLIAYFWSDKIVLKMYGAHPLDRARYNHIYEMIQELAYRSKLPMPKVWIIENPMANAFATGRNPSHASIAVTTGIITLLEPHELRAVLAHEMGHIKNRDILISTIAATLATAISYIAHMAQYSLYFRSHDRRERNSNFLVAFLGIIITPLAASLLQLAVSRSREYLADETGAHTCGDPLALASALDKLERNIPYAHLGHNDTQRASTASLFIVNPFLGKGLIKLFSTHPPIKDRIARLQGIHQNMIDHW